MSGRKPLSFDDAVILDLDGSLVVRFSKPLEGKIREAVFEPEALFALALELGEPAEIPGERKAEVVLALAVSGEAVEELIEDAEAGEADDDEAEAAQAAVGGGPREIEVKDAEIIDVTPEPKPEN